MNFIFSFLLLIGGIEPDTSIATDALDFQVDKLDHIYFIHSTFVEKLDSEGNFLFRTGDLGYGTIHSLDVSDPLKPFLYFKDQGIIYQMDNTLSLQGSIINTFETEYNQVECVGWSRDNNFWIWDAIQSELSRVDGAFNRINSSGNLQALLGKGISPRQIIESGYFVYMFDPKLGLLVFDVFGNYSSTFSLSTNGPLQLTETNVIYADSTHLHILEKNLLVETSFPLPLSSTSRVMCSGKKMMTLQNGALLIYDLEKISAIRN
ncbi:MAG: hypothetical protein SH856_13965 [Flavobacteriales bacterium]|nr:hypothetical protein [Flavobacteriales bacterium]